MKEYTLQISAGTPPPAEIIRAAAAALVNSEVQATEKANFLRALAQRGETPEKDSG
jgi:anthranilate phosphoribosyltransferase